MKNIINEIEQKCNTCIEAEVSGISFELNCQKENEESIRSDIIQYLPNNSQKYREDICFGKRVEIYYITDNKMFEKMKKYTSGKKSIKVQVFKSNLINKFADFYDDNEYRIFYCDIEPYYLCTVENKIYIVLRTDSLNINRLYFRVIVEFILRAKRMMGYHMIHAACVSVGEKAFIICGEKGAGKTTLMSHLLNSGKVDFIANDKVFLTPDLTTVEYLPLVARIGGGTLNKFSKYDLENDYYRITKNDKEKGKAALGDDKWDFTPVEMANIFMCRYKKTGQLDTVLIPNIGEKNDEKITRVSKDVLDYDLFSGKHIKIKNWLLNDTWVDYYTNQNNARFFDEKGTYKVFQVDYNYESKSSEIMDKICEETNLTD